MIECASEFSDLSFCTSRTSRSVRPVFGIWSRNIDSRSGTNEQQRFKRTDAPIRLLQISISQSLLGDFCNTIRPKADINPGGAGIAPHSTASATPNPRTRRARPPSMPHASRAGVTTSRNRAARAGCPPRRQEMRRPRAVRGYRWPATPALGRARGAREYPGGSTPPLLQACSNLHRRRGPGRSAPDGREDAVRGGTERGTRCRHAQRRCGSPRRDKEFIASRPRACAGF